MMPYPVVPISSSAASFSIALICFFPTHALFAASRSLSRQSGYCRPFFTFDEKALRVLSLPVPYNHFFVLQFKLFPGYTGSAELSTPHPSYPCTSPDKITLGRKMKNILLVLTFVLTAVVTATPGHHHQKHHHRYHRKHPKHSKSLSKTPSVVPSSTVIPIPSFSPKPASSSPSAAGTSALPSSIGSSGFPASTPTSFGTSIQPSASSKPVVHANSTNLLASSGFPRSFGTSAAPSATSSAAPSSGTPCADFLRGVNIGGWLLLDSVLNAKLLSAADASSQWSFDSSSGSAEKLDDHWNSYFTEADLQSLKEYGVNAIKIPVGYWAWDNSGTPYKQGADAHLEKAVGWAAAAGIKVWIDVSNTDTSATRVAEASADYAMTHSLDILTTIATKYGSADYADTVTAIQIFDCPVSSPNSDAATHEAFTSKAYSTIRKAAKNPNLQVIMPDGSSSPRDWIPTAQAADSTKGMFAVAESMSELSCPCEQEMTQKQHIQQACERGYNIAGLNHDSISIYVGDFNPATNATLNTEGWTEDVVTDVRKYVEANLAVFEAYTSGYFFWSWAVDAQEVTGVGWGFKGGIEKGYIPKPLNDRSQFKYPGLCDV